MTTCTCRTCNCSEEEIAAYNAATSPLRLALDELEREEAQKIGDEKKGEYELASLTGRVFYHEKADHVELLDRALDWLAENEDLGVLNIRYDNSFEGGTYSESVTVIAELA